MDIGRPLDLYREVVCPEYIDWNGHLNMAYYVLIFDHATDAFYDYAGLDAGHRERGHSNFTLESVVTYQREVKEGDPVRVTTQLLDYNHKLLHYFHRMYHAEEGFLSATNELLSLHVGLETRRSAPFSEEIMACLGEIHTAHAELPRPPEAGRVIGIRRSPAGIGRIAGA